ncbi:MAG: dihydroorotase [Ruminococcaceae bacterium]|nr:dihydroorotase [Oscillospiraceae bacterium]
MNQLIKGANIYYRGAFKRLDVLICDGIISDIADSISFSDNTQIINCPDCFMFPGFADVHVHFREPGFSYKETIKNGSMCAAKGGYTAVCLMPNLIPAPDTPEHIQEQLDIIERDAVIKCYPYSSITVGRKGRGELVDMEKMSRYAVAFTDDGTGIQEKELMDKAMKQAAKRKLLIAAHCEDESLLNGGYIHDGEYARLNGHKGISSESEYAQVDRDIKICEKYGTRYHVCHISTAETVELVRKAKAKGLNVSCETGPHYLTMCDMDIENEGRFKMNPPIRSASDRDALVQGIVDGTIEIIATDHAPHSKNEKRGGLRESLMGVVGLETAFPVLYTELVKKGIITLEKLVELMSVNPRKRFGLESAEIEKGAEANLCIWRLSSKYTVNSEDFISAGKATPFEGKEVYGQNLMTILGKNTVWKR